MIDVVFALVAMLEMPDASIQRVTEVYMTRQECRQVRSEVIEKVKQNPGPTQAGVVKMYLSECEAVPVHLLQ